MTAPQKFAFKDWNYQSYLVPATPDNANAAPGKPVGAVKWAAGRLSLDSPDGKCANGVLEFPGLGELKIAMTLADGVGDAPAVIQATGVGASGAVAGSLYQLVGWLIVGPDGELASIRGVLRLARGATATPDVGPGGIPLGTSGMFNATKPVAPLAPPSTTSATQ